MNKNLEIRKNVNILFVINIIILITMIFFRDYYGKLGYTNFIINTVLIIDLIILIVGIIYNVLFVKDADKYDNKKTTIIVITIFIIYLVLNTFGTIIFNNIVRGSYLAISSKVSGYCKKYVCDKYETIYENGNEVFIINNKFYDYDKKENELEIRTTYNKDEIVSVVATVYSRKQMFSETLIKEEIKDYYYNFGITIDETKIRDAFNKRFNGSIDDGNVNYKVMEVYNKSELEKLKTIITLNMKQD